MQICDSGATVPVVVAKFKEQSQGSALLEVRGRGKSTYLLGSQVADGSESGQATLDGLAAVVIWTNTSQLRSVLLQEGRRLELFAAPGDTLLAINTSSQSTLSLKLIASDQYQLLVHSGTADTSAVTVELVLPWSADSTEINVWDSGHSCTRASLAVSCVPFPAVNEISTDCLATTLVEQGMLRTRVSVHPYHFRRCVGWNTLLRLNARGQTLVEAGSGAFVKTVAICRCDKYVNRRQVARRLMCVAYKRFASRTCVQETVTQIAAITSRPRP